jgi:hypothetical protein
MKQKQKPEEANSVDAPENGCAAILALRDSFDRGELSHSVLYCMCPSWPDSDVLCERENVDDGRLEKRRSVAFCLKDAEDQPRIMPDFQVPFDIPKSRWSRP